MRFRSRTQSAFSSSGLKSAQASRYVAVTGMHGVSESLVDKPFRAMLDGASMVVSDGMPLVWLGRWHGYKNMVRRVYGPELMETFCRETGGRYRHFFYGGAEGVPELLAKVMHEKFGVYGRRMLLSAVPPADAGRGQGASSR